MTSWPGISLPLRGAAFTLIELLLVIAIIAILAALLTPTVESAEKVFGFFEKAPRDGVHAFIAKFGEFLEFGPLGVVEVGGNFDGDADVEVSMAEALDVFDAFALEAESGAGLGAGRDFDVRLAAQRGDFHLRAESGLHEAHRHFADQIIAVALKDVVRLDVEDNV